MLRAGIAAIALLALVPSLALAQTGPPERRIEIHLFGGDVTAGAPLATWYRDIGITDLWLYPFRGAFPQDQRPEDQRTPEEARELLAAYGHEGISCWWMERPVPDVFYQTAKADGRHLWDGSPGTDALWDSACASIASIYPKVRDAGFRGLVYDNEAYYSYQGEGTPWVWGGHDAEVGEDGHYYRRGLQVGEAIHDAWPEAIVVMAYAFGYPGERWWYQGVLDAGVDVRLGPEHTYGAGPPKDLGDAWYQSWWQGRHLRETCDWKRTQFPFVRDNTRMLAGLFPIDFGARKPNYRARYFREQLEEAATADRAGPIPVWIWPQGPFTPESWGTIEYAAGDSAEEYMRAMREWSARGR